MNRKADISITLFVIAVIALFSFALFTFYISNVNVRSNFVGGDVLEEVIAKQHSIDFYLNQGKSPEESAGLVGGGFNEDSFFISKERSVEERRFFLFKETKTILSVDYRYDFGN